MTAPSAYARLGLRVADITGGTASVDLVPDLDAADGDGGVHLAVIAGLAQAAIEQAIGSTLDGDRGAAFDLKLTRVRPLAAGTAARATARVVHRGRTTAVAECRVVAGADTLIATASGTAAIASG